jgi:hypothetical protein
VLQPIFLEQNFDCNKKWWNIKNIKYFQFFAKYKKYWEILRGEERTSKDKESLWWINDGIFEEWGNTKNKVWRFNLELFYQYSDFQQYKWRKIHLFL